MIVAGDVLPVHDLGAGRRLDLQLTMVVPGDAGEDLRLALVALEQRVVGAQPWRRVRAVTEKIQLLHVAHRHAVDRHEVEQREDGGVGADAQRERDERRRRERGRPSHLTEAVAQVLPKLVDVAQAARPAGVFLDAFDAAEGEACAPMRLLRLDARSHEIGLVRVEMEPHLFGHVVFELPATDERARERPKACEHLRLPPLTLLACLG